MQHSNVIDLVKLSCARQLLDSAIQSSPNILSRLTLEDVNMAYQSEQDTQIISLRIDRKLVAAIDQYTREQALKRGERITRNRMINELCDVALSALRRLEKAKSQQPGNPES